MTSGKQNLSIAGLCMALVAFFMALGNDLGYIMMGIESLFFVSIVLDRKSVFTTTVRYVVAVVFMLTAAVVLSQPIEETDRLASNQTIIALWAIVIGAFVVIFRPKVKNNSAGTNQQTS